MTTTMMSRRGFFSTAAVAAAAAALPSLTPANEPRADWAGARATAHEVFRGAYLREVEALAHRLRPRFESGELVPWTDDRWELWQDACVEAYPRPAPRFGVKAPPLWRLETVCRRLLAPTAAAAHLVLAVSPSSSTIDPEITTGQARSAAGDATALDVLQVARAAGWIP